MKSEVEKVVEKGLKDYPGRTIRISDREYPLFVFLEDEDLNLFEGFVVAKVKDKSELSALRKYKPPVSGYVARFSIIFYKDQLLIGDYRRNKSIRKTLSKINKTFIRKLKKALTDPKEENFNKLFDRSDIIEEFYILYKKSRDYLLANIKGISDDEKREEFVDNFMMQMLTLWYLQERGFFNGDKSYFITKFKEMAQKKLVGGFNSYYDFLNYFFEKISDYSDSQYYEDKTVGRVVVVGPAVFINGEHSAEAISIPDKCFYKEGMTEILINTPPKKVSDDVPLLNLFESRDWTEGNIDEFVLGSIYEKLITYMERKKLGAYYTPEEITSYICKNTIEPYLIDRINEMSGKSFESIDEIIESGNKETLIYLFEQLREIKILDPAVGSAHFLESAINVLTEIYERVWEKAKELGIKKLEIVASDKKGRIKRINLMDEVSNEEQFRLYVKFFIILSRNIYGVDINPSALKVARARLFLTLAKHFRVGKENDIFIRFPNVHFNLRAGNSLIGYVELERERQEGQLVLDLFVKEDKAPYRLKPIREHLEHIEDYLVQAAKDLGIKGNITKEVEELDDILSKDKITWRDFEKVLRTKEKLIRILIASLNSSYAKPLNELLNRITELFNNRLDEKFAEEHGIELEELKQIKTFHWIFEFPEVFLRENPGFDVVIGNPPYFRLSTLDSSYKVLLKSLYKFFYLESNAFSVFTERSRHLLSSLGYFSYITHKNLFNLDSYSALRKDIIEKNKVLLLADAKKDVFVGVTGETVIFVLRKSLENGIILFAKRIGESFNIIGKLSQEKYRDFVKSWNYRFIIYAPESYPVIDEVSRQSVSLGEICSISRGIETGNNKKFLRKERISKEWYPVIRGKDIARYFIHGYVFLNYSKKLSHPLYPQLIVEKKIVTQQNSMFPTCYYDRGIFYVLNSATFMKVKEKWRNKVSPGYIISILNSELMRYLFMTIFTNRSTLTINILPNNLAILPIKLPPTQQSFITLCDYMLFLNATEERRTKEKELIDFIDKQIIDSLIYELYFKEKFHEDGLYAEPKEYLLESVSKHLKPINYDRWAEIYWKKQLDGVLADKEEKELQKLEKENMKTIEEVYQSSLRDQKINELVERIKSHEWVRVIEGEN